MNDSSNGRKPRGDFVKAAAAVAAVGLTLTSCGNGPITSANGDWTGSATGPDDKVGIRFSLKDGSGGAVSGEFLLQDPDNHQWIYGGDVTGHLKDGRLSLSVDSGSSFDLSGKGGTIEGTGDMPDETGSLKVNVSANRA